MSFDQSILENMHDIIQDEGYSEGMLYAVQNTASMQRSKASPGAEHLQAPRPDNILAAGYHPEPEQDRVRHEMRMIKSGSGIMDLRPHSAHQPVPFWPGQGR